MKCYAFPDRDTFVASCEALGWASEGVVSAYTSDRAIDEVGPVQTLPGTYDEGGVELTPPTYDNRHHVNYIGDVVESWEQYRCYPNSPSRLFAGGSIEPQVLDEPSGT